MMPMPRPSCLVDDRAVALLLDQFHGGIELPSAITFD
jgi:hypothetical protein